jgi:hypothetical protein
LEEERIVSNILKSNLQSGTIILTIQHENDKEYEIIKTFGEDPQAYTLPQKSHISLESLEQDFECDICLKSFSFKRHRSSAKL